MSTTRPIFVTSVAVSFFSVATAYPLTSWLGLNGTIIGLVAVPVLGFGFLAAAYWDALREAKS